MRILLFLIAVGAFALAAYAGPKRGSLSGKCTISPQRGASFEEPCPSLVLKLIDSHGAVVSKARCNALGEFAFTTPVQGKFYIQPESDSFALDAKPKAAENGEWIDVRLKRR